MGDSAVMTLIAKIMLCIFVAAWFVAVGAWFYAARYWFPMWATGFRKRDDHAGDMRKALRGFGVFIVAVAVGFAAGGIAQVWGGGWPATY